MSPTPRTHLAAALGLALTAGLPGAATPPPQKPEEPPRYRISGPFAHENLPFRWIGPKATAGSPSDTSPVSKYQGSVPIGPTIGTPVRAVQPVYSGCTHERPPSKLKCTPEEPTPGVNGQGDSGVAKTVVPHGAMSISSFDPAATTRGREASIATDGSFCLLRGNVVNGLPTVTRASFAAPAEAVSVSASAATSAARTHQRRCETTLI